MGAVTVKHDDELERDYGKWVLVRRSLGVGIVRHQRRRAPPGDSIPEHDETERGARGALPRARGHADARRRRRRARAATRARSRASSPSRSGRSGTTATRVARVLIVSAPVTSGYEPMGWA